MTTSDPLTSQQRWCRYGVFVCLAIQFVLACDTARQLTPTHDEYWHLPIGLLLWKTGRFECDVINPPLFRLWAAFPLFLGGARLDTDPAHPTFGEIGDHFWMSNPEHRMLWFALGRAMVALVNAGTGWLLAGWGRRWFGDVAGLTAAFLWCCCPNALAHGSLVTHDAAATFGFVSTLFAIVCWCEQPTWRRAVVAGVCLGIAQLLKVTCILLFPLSFCVWLLIPPQSFGAASSFSSFIVHPSSFPHAVKPTWRRSSLQWLMVIGIAIVAINVGYLGQQTCQSLRSIPFSSKRFQQLQQVAGLNSLPVPIPKYHLQAFDRVALDLQNGHPVFLEDQWNERGFVLYYVKALEYKMPLGTWFMIVLAAVHLWSRWRSRTPTESREWSITWRRQGVLLLPILALVVPASLGSNQLGIRYVLPILPMIHLFTSQAAIPLSDRPWRWRQWMVVAALISLPFSLRYHPHHLAYFNEWAGGPDKARNLMVDSNIDWGQDLHGLAKYLRENHIDRIGLAYFGTVHPHSVGIQFELPPTHYPRSGDYAISVNFLMGRSFLIRTPTPTGEAPTPKFGASNEPSGVVTTQDDEFHYFRFFEPRARIGHSIYVYHVTNEDIARYRRALLSVRRPQ